MTTATDYCPHCEAPVARGDKECMFCRKSLVITSGPSPFSVASVGCAIIVVVASCFSFFMVEIPARHIGVVERGIQREILPAGRHVVNPFLWEVKVVECVEIPPGYVGIINGKMRPPGRYQLPADQVQIIELGKREFSFFDDDNGGSVF